MRASDKYRSANRKKSNPTKETGRSGIEAKAKQYMRESCGGKTYKFVSPGCNGVPDDLFTHVNCGPFFMEFKSKGKKLQELQEYVCDEMIMHGCRVYKGVDSLEKAINIIDHEVYGFDLDA